MHKNKKLLTTRELANKTGYTVREVMNKVRSGELAPTKIDPEYGIRLFALDALDAKPYFSVQTKRCTDCHYWNKRWCWLYERSTSYNRVACDQYEKPPRWADRQGGGIQ